MTCDPLGEPKQSTQLQFTPTGRGDPQHHRFPPNGVGGGGGCQEQSATPHQEYPTSRSTIAGIDDRAKEGRPRQTYGVAPRSQAAAGAARHPPILKAKNPPASEGTEKEDPSPTPRRQSSVATSHCELARDQPPGRNCLIALQSATLTKTIVGSIGGTRGPPATTRAMDTKIRRHCEDKGKRRAMSCWQRLAHQSTGSR